MILQPMQKVSVLDVSIYGLSIGVDPFLVQWKPQSQTMPPSVKLRQDLVPIKTSYMSMRMSSSRASPPKAPLPLTNLHHEVIS